MTAESWLIHLILCRLSFRDWGMVDWSKYVSALTDIGYDGCTCIEVEDRAFEGSKEK